jgi:hypothetical protein
MEEPRKVFRILIGKSERGLGLGEVTALKWGSNKCGGSLWIGFCKLLLSLKYIFDFIRGKYLYYIGDH